MAKFKTAKEAKSYIRAKKKGGPDFAKYDRALHEVKVSVNESMGGSRSLKCSTALIGLIDAHNAKSKINAHGELDDASDSIYRKYEEAPQALLAQARNLFEQECVKPEARDLPDDDTADLDDEYDEDEDNEESEREAEAQMLREMREEEARIEREDRQRRREQEQAAAAAAYRPAPLPVPQPIPQQLPPMPQPASPGGFFDRLRLRMKRSR